MHGKVLEPELLAGLLQGVEERGLVETSQVLIMGYLGSTDNAAIVAEFVERACKLNPELIYVCDPVMGDDDLGLFVKDGLVEVFRNRLAPLASIVTPNQYELKLLAGQKAPYPKRLLLGNEDPCQKRRSGRCSNRVCSGRHSVGPCRDSHLDGTQIGPDCSSTPSHSTLWHWRLDHCPACCWPLQGKNPVRRGRRRNAGNLCRAQANACRQLPGNAHHRLPVRLRQTQADVRPQGRT